MTQEDTLTLIINQLKEKAEECQLNKHIINNIDDLINDREKNQYSIVVVGEFKHGKSTFINSLIGKELLPTDILPTTAVLHRIFRGSKDEIVVHMLNGDTFHHDLKPETLEEYTAQSTDSMEQTKYIDLSLKEIPFQQDVVIVDTPGVNDLNQQRAEIAYDFIPRADVVFFVLDSGSFLKRSEELFIKEKLLKHDLKKIVFIANFIDRLDEEETDFEDLIDSFKRRITHALAIEQPSLYLLSSLSALRGRMENNKELIAYSGILPIEEKMTAIIQNGVRTEEKLKVYGHRAIYLNKLMNEEINATLISIHQSTENLMQQLKNLDKWEQQKEETKQHIDDYVQLRETEIGNMIEKSIQKLNDRLLEEGYQAIANFDGTDISQLTEKILPQLSERYFKGWLEEYAPYILELLNKLKQSIEKGLNDYFNSTIELGMVGGRKLDATEKVEVDVETGLDTTITSGLIAGGLATGLAVIALPLFIPLLAMGGFPILRDIMKKNKLAKLKPEIKREWQNVIPESVERFNESIGQQLELLISNIANEAQDLFNEKADIHRQIIEKRLSKNEVITQALHEREQLLRTTQTYLEDLDTRLQLLLLKSSKTKEEPIL